MWEYRTKAQKRSQHSGVGVKPIRRQNKRRGLWVGVTLAPSDLTAPAGLSRLKRDTEGHLRGVLMTEVECLPYFGSVMSFVCVDGCMHTRPEMQYGDSFILK